MSIQDEFDCGGQEVYPVIPSPPKPPLAKRIRDFFETLFPDKLVLQLRAELNETRHERDYFKGRAERLELQLLQPRIAARTAEAATPSPGTRLTGTHGGRKLWPQVVAERRAELNDLARKAAGAKQDTTSAPAKPAQN